MTGFLGQLAAVLVKWAHPRQLELPHKTLDTKAPSVTIESLPPELLCHIFDYLGSQTSVKDFYSLCLTTKTLSAVALRFLYEECGQIDNQQCPESLRGLLRSLSQIPTFQSYLKCLTVTMFKSVPPPPGPTLAEYCGFFQALKPISGHRKLHARLSMALKSGSYDAEAALLLLLAPCVESIIFHLPDPRLYEAIEKDVFVPQYTEERSLVGEVLDTMMSLDGRTFQGKPFKHLRALQIAQYEFSENQFRLPFRTLLALLSLPTLHYLVVIGGSAHGDLSNIGNAPTISSNVGCLALLDYAIDTVSLQAIFLCCKALRAVHIGTLQQEDHSEAVGVDVDVLRASLEKHKDSLSRFDFIPRLQYPSRPGVFCWGQFTRLRVLEANSFLFNGIDIRGDAPPANIDDDPLFQKGALDRFLPPALHTLKLHLGWLFDEMPVILRAFATVRSSTLKVVTLVFEADEEEWKDFGNVTSSPRLGISLAREPRTDSWSPSLFSEAFSDTEETSDEGSDEDLRPRFAVKLAPFKKVQNTLPLLADLIDAKGPFEAFSEHIVQRET